MHESPLDEVLLLRCSQPSKMYNKVTLRKDFRRVAKAIKKETSDNFYRPDLQRGVFFARDTGARYCSRAALSMLCACLLIHDLCTTLLRSCACQVEPYLRVAKEEGEEVDYPDAHREGGRTVYCQWRQHDG